MKTWLAVAILILCIPAQGSHPLHLSVTNITIENGILKVNIKTFRDDWEVAFFHEHGRPIDLTQTKNREGPWFRDYLNRSFRISPEKGGKAFELELGTVSVEEDAMQIELQANLGKELNSLYIYQAILTDIYPDQNNLVILSYGKRETGIKFDVRKLEEKVTLE